jgi:hypothetical protein
LTWAFIRPHGFFKAIQEFYTTSKKRYNSCQSILAELENERQKALVPKVELVSV